MAGFHKRLQSIGTRERILDVQRRYPDRLFIQTNTLATRILLDDSQRAIGVEYQRGERLYRAQTRAAPQGNAPVRDG